MFANLEKDDKSGENVEFYYPSIRFNLVFSLIHIYRHVFEEGIGLRQLTDYYYILNYSTEQERSEAYMTLKSFGLKSFSEALMYVMNQVYGIAEEHLPSKLDEKEGMYLLEEIMRGGNFGKYDDRNKFLPNERRIARGMLNAKRNLRFLKRYPNEVIWMPVWKIWH